MRQRYNFDSYVRLSFEDLPSLIPILRGKRIANNLSYEKSLMMANLYECLLDPKIKLNPKQFEIFKLNLDIGVNILQIGTIGGGYHAPYRCFNLDFNNENFFVGIGLNQARNKVRSWICVALKKISDKKFHHSLILNVDDYMEVKKNFCIFTHKGNIGLGSLGSGKISILRDEYVKVFYPKIIDEKNFFLGKLPNDKILSLNDECMIDFIENLISYSLVRDIYREDSKKVAGLI